MAAKNPKWPPGIFFFLHFNIRPLWLSAHHRDRLVHTRSSKHNIMLITFEKVASFFGQQTAVADSQCFKLTKWKIKNVLFNFFYFHSVLLWYQQFGSNHNMATIWVNSCMKSWSGQQVMWINKGMFAILITIK